MSFLHGLVLCGLTNISMKSILLLNNLGQILDREEGGDHRTERASECVSECLPFCGLKGHPQATVVCEMGISFLLLLLITLLPLIFLPELMVHLHPRDYISEEAVR